MKFKVTPFTVIGLIAIIATFYYGYNPPRGYGALFFLVTGFLFVIAFVLDLIFRFAMESLKTIWIVEAVLAVIGIIFLFV